MTTERQVHEDSLYHFQLREGQFRCAIALTTASVREAQRRHQLDPLATIALGRALSCGALLASTLKHDVESVHCSFAGEGPLGTVIAECTGKGDMRGYVTRPRLIEILNEGDKVPESVSEALGPGGMVTVIRGRAGDQHPHRAVASFMNGGVASDMARFYSESDQIPSAVAAGVKLSTEAEVVAAGGVLVQKLGGADVDEELLQELEKKVGEELNISERIAAGDTPDEIAQFLEESGKTPGLLGQRPLRFQCTCNRSKMASSLYALGQDELKKIKAEHGKLEVRCHYCNDMQQFELEELEPQ